MRKLGFGCMRLPLAEAGNFKAVDIAEVERMVDTFLERGFTYFDTAYMYHDFHSECVVREALVEQQRAIAADDDIAMEGRDIGTVVFPNAEVKIFLTASPEERARRRALQNAEKGYGETDPAVILADIIARDEADSSREVAPLKPAGDAIELDTTGMTIDEVCERIASIAAEKRA